MSRKITVPIAIGSRKYVTSETYAVTVWLSLLFFSLGIAFAQAKVLDTDKIESQLAQMRDKFAQEEESQLNKNKNED